MRQVVAYDDLTESAQSSTSTSTGVIGPEIPSHLKVPQGEPPAKKRKRNAVPPHNWETLPIQHRDDPGMNQGKLYYDDHEELDLQVSSTMHDNADEQEDAGDDESRELTHEEIWDDSALIDAWDAANEEYEAMHGAADKSWKRERVKDSSLWYNVPPETLPDRAKSKVKVSGDDEQHDTALPTPPSSHSISDHHKEDTSRPLDFDTYVPAHDASLSFSAPPQLPFVPRPNTSTYYSHILSEPPASHVNADEAFSRALEAMYWGGYWTAMYHAQRRVEQQPVMVPRAADAEQSGEDDGPEVGDLIATQR